MAGQQDVQGPDRDAAIEAPPPLTLEELGLTGLATSTSAGRYGKRYGQVPASEEGAYAAKQLNEHAAVLQGQDIGAEEARLLRALLYALPRSEARAAALRAYQLKASQDLSGAQDAAIDDVVKTRNRCEKALSKAAPEAIEAYPLVSAGRGHTPTTISVTQRAAAFVGAWRHALVAGGMKDCEEVERRLLARAVEVNALNERQELAKTRSEDAHALCAQIRGHIYLTAGGIYRAGRAAFRTEPDIKARFRYQVMKAPPKKGGSSGSASAPPEGSAPASGDGSAPA